MTRLSEPALIVMPYAAAGVLGLAVFGLWLAWRMV